MKGNDPIKCKIELIPQNRIIYMRQAGPYGKYNIILMEKFKDILKEADLFDDASVILGISQDNPHLTDPHLCRYDVCLIISNGMVISTPLLKEAIIAEGHYMVITVSHTVDE